MRILTKHAYTKTQGLKRLLASLLCAGNVPGLHNQKNSPGDAHTCIMHYVLSKVHPILSINSMLCAGFTVLLMIPGVGF